MSGMIVREARSEETSIIVELAIRSFDSTFRGACADSDLDAYIEEALNERTFRDEIEDPSSNFLVAVESDGPGILGYAKLRQGTENGVSAAQPIELQRIYVDPDRKGEGIGSSLLARCLQIASDAGHDVIWLGVWEHNPDARRFYESKGFDYCGSHVFIVGTDAQTDLLMQRSVVRE